MATKTTPKKPATETKDTETKQAKFVRLANARVSKAVKSIYLISNLGGPGYESTDEQRAKIELALTEAVQAVMSRLNKVQTKSKGFSL